MKDKKYGKPYTIHGISYHFHPDLDYDKAEAYLKEIGEWDYVSTHGFSVDGWSIIASANSIWDERNKNSTK